MPNQIGSSVKHAYISISRVAVAKTENSCGDLVASLFFRDSPGVWAIIIWFLNFEKSNLVYREEVHSQIYWAKIV